LTLGLTRRALVIGWARTSGHCAVGVAEVATSLKVRPRPHSAPPRHLTAQSYLVVLPLHNAKAAQGSGDHPNPRPVPAAYNISAIGCSGSNPRKLKRRPRAPCRATLAGRPFQFPTACSGSLRAGGRLGIAIAIRQRKPVNQIHDRTGATGNSPFPSKSNDRESALESTCGNGWFNHC